MMISREEYELVLAGYTITDCVVRDRRRFTFVATRFFNDAEVEEEVEEMRDPSFRDKRVLPFMRDDAPGDQWGCTTLLNWDLLRGGAAHMPENQFVGVDLEGHVFVTGSGVSEQEQDMPAAREGGPNRGGMRKLKTIDGCLYACGGARSVGKRVGRNQWVSHTQALPRHAEIGRGGFDDIDGFAEDDIYAVGGKADVWHHDGKRWAQVEIPADTWTNAVCCAGDGSVYIAAHDGIILKGRGNRWEVIHRGGSSLGIRDLVWYEDRVWCSSDYGLWTIQDDRLERAKLPPEISACDGHLYEGDGVLLTAGLGGAAFREDGQWYSILVRAEMEELVARG